MEGIIKRFYSYDKNTKINQPARRRLRGVQAALLQVPDIQRKIHIAHGTQDFGFSTGFLKHVRQLWDHPKSSPLTKDQFHGVLKNFQDTFVSEKQDDLNATQTIHHSEVSEKLQQTGKAQKHQQSSNPGERMNVPVRKQFLDAQDPVNSNINHSHGRGKQNTYPRMFLQDSKVFQTLRHANFETINGFASRLRTPLESYIKIRGPNFWRGLYDKSRLQQFVLWCRGRPRQPDTIYFHLSKDPIRLNGPIPTGCGEDVFDAAPRVAIIERVTGYKFKDKVLCVSALKADRPESSLQFGELVVPVPSNHRLALIGDRLLSMHLCKLWYAAGRGTGMYAPYLLHHVSSNNG